jgi:Asp-tRNA(Asn)/Glu-tRNA(Gln) amidotransferase A subunit family amidase
MEPWKLTASEAFAQIQADKLSVQEYAKSLLERIDERDKDVQAWAYLDEEIIMQQAKSLDEVPKKNRGPLHGLPIAVKDVIVAQTCQLSSTHRYTMGTSLRQMPLLSESFVMLVLSSLVLNLSSLCFLKLTG